ncbi:2-octaprenyl-6-methoxyphenyl hydroxylase [Thioflavicoccus mobilis]|uniref:2-octaprenyl-6-methoxyphenyl hydroxylase n=1 Tax=Thioflavicoccus mobilis TaxID=80679 RepID=UPI0005A086D4|nr:2-octaprenyl-6-methoxyphenyl hydroxylase [Thioflavicoccus mobilis]
MSAREYDLIIVGGGLVGGGLACALRGAGLRVAVIEATSPGAATHPSYDERVIALSWTSRRILEGIGLWPRLGTDAEPIRTVQVSQRGGCGEVWIDRRAEAVDALGHVVPARVIGAAIHDRLANATDIVVHAPARVVDVRVTPQWAELEVDQSGLIERLRARLIVAADGGDSSVRQRLGIAVRERPYGQDAVIATVTPDRPQVGAAFERFTESGPLALLPMTDGRWSLVWSVPQEQTAGVLALSDQDFLARLQTGFGYRLGRFVRASSRRAFPLVQRLAGEASTPRVALIGNAAHTLHPVAGQGLNLGLRDVAALAEVLVAAHRAGGDLGRAAVLGAYRSWRRRDQTEVAATTDFLARAFIGGWAPLRQVRDLGLLGIEFVPVLRHQLARRLMGRAGRQTRLARGLPLEVQDG